MSAPDVVGQFVDRINDWYNDPVLFAEEVFGCVGDWELDVWQQEFLRTIAGGVPRVTVRAGRGVGKSAVVSILIIWFLLTRQPATILVTAPKADQIQDIIWREVERWRHKLPEALRGALVVQADKIYVTGLEKINEALARTARQENTDALRGYHDKNMLVIGEESSGIPDATLVVAEGTMSTPGAITALIGNMSRTSGYFFDTHFRDDRWHRIHVNCEDVAARGHPWFDGDYIEFMGRRYGRDSDEYRIEVLGEPPSQEERSVIPFYMADSAMGRDVARLPGYLPVWGLDVARYGRDRTALAKRCGNHQLEPVKWWRGKDTMQTVGLVVMEYREQERKDPKMLPARIMVDVIGVGAGVVDRLREQGLPVTGINVGESASDSERYMRKRDELWFNCRDWLESRSARLHPEDKELRGELTMPFWETTSTGKKKVESKDEMKKRLNCDSPDLADAWNLTFAAGYDRMPEEVTPERYKGVIGRNRWRTEKGAPSWASV